MNEKITFDDILFGKQEVDLYEILDCNPFSTRDQICAEYRAKVMKYHPDKHPNDPKAIETYYLLNKAYEILSQPKERALYDQWRSSGLEIPFETWRGMEEEKRNSYHWANKKEGPQMLESNQEHKKGDSGSLPDSSQKSQSNQHFSQASPNSLLEKFRNYQV